MGAFLASLVPPEGPVEVSAGIAQPDGMQEVELEAARTLGLLEHALVDAGLEGAVKERVEGLLRDGDAVVGLDVLLQGLPAAAVAVLELRLGTAC